LQSCANSGCLSLSQSLADTFTELVVVENAESCLYLQLLILKNVLATFEYRVVGVQHYSRLYASYNNGSSRNVLNANH